MREGTGLLPASKQGYQHLLEHILINYFALTAKMQYNIDHKKFSNSVIPIPDINKGDIYAAIES